MGCSNSSVWYQSSNYCFILRELPTNLKMLVIYDPIADYPR